jgi:hypothetical protein
MKWTTAKPTTPGWYWHRWSDGTCEQIVRIVEDGGPRLVAYGTRSKAGYAIPMDDYWGDHGQWSSCPVPRPEEVP